MQIIINKISFLDLLVLVMVRVLHAIYRSLLQDHGWNGNYSDTSSSSMVFNATASTDKVVEGHLKHVISRFTIVCTKGTRAHPLGIFYGENPLSYSFSLFLFDLVLVILITMLVRFLLKPLKQPRIISEILGGIIIGPSVLGRSKRFSTVLFPENSQFLIRNIGIMGFMLFLFLAGVKMDLSLVKKSGKKHIYMALVGVFVPMFTVGTLGYMLRPSMDKSLATAAGIGAVSTNLSIPAYPVIYLILKELNLLSSEVGRLALSSAIIGDVLGIAWIIIFEALKQSEIEKIDALWYVISSLVIAAFLITVVRRVLVWIVEKTPEGAPISQNNVVMIFVAVLAMGFLTDMFGLAIANGSLWLGLVLPDGPPLGSTMVDKCETILNDLIMPFSFALVGLNTDVFAMIEYGWKGVWPLLAMVLTAYLVKFISIFVVALYQGIPWKDGLTLSLIMNLRGELELVLFVHWIDKRLIGIPLFTMLVLVMVTMTGICTPLISILYDPTKPYMVNKRRTIQHTPPGRELRIVVGLHDKEGVISLIRLLDISYPSHSGPFSVFALRLVELIGRANPLLIDHDLSPKEASKYADHEIIENALMQYQETRSEYVNLHLFTAATVNKSMYQDICELAMLKKAALILLLFDKAKVDDVGETEVVFTHGSQTLNSDVLAHAPCSVGIFVDKGSDISSTVIGSSFRRSATHKYVMLFLGGADAREALVYSDRMVANPDVTLMVIRFLAYNNEGEIDMEKKLDDGVVTWFWVKNEQNERVTYREVVVKDGEETLAAIQALHADGNELWIVGRGQGINPVLLQGLTSWSENQELGVIGDFVATTDFGGSASVLVVQQQIMRQQGGPNGVVVDAAGVQGSRRLGCSRFSELCNKIKGDHATPQIP